MVRVCVCRPWPFALALPAGPAFAVIGRAIVAIRAPVRITVPSFRFIIFSSFWGLAFTPVRSKGDAKRKWAL